MLMDGCGGFSCESMLEYRASRPTKGRALKPDQELESYPVNDKCFETVLVQKQHEGIHTPL